MIRRLARWYSRRIVNINVNIVVAGLAALVLTMGPVHFSRYLGIQEHWQIVVFTQGVDLCFDVVVYFALHWVANQWPGLKRLAHPEVRGEGPTLEAASKPSFFKDASVVQAQRAVLSPLLYLVWFVVQYVLLESGMDRVWAGAIGAVAGILLSRVLHTAWMLREEKRRGGEQRTANSEQRT
jgi:hypothetical protein